MEWDKLNRKFLPIPWASFPSEDGPLLVKLLYQPAQNNLAIMATDLQSVYYESLNSRQTNRRFEDALAASADTQSQSQSQDVMVGIGQEGEKVLHDLVEELLTSVASGIAKGRISHEAFEHLITLTTPSGHVVRFLTTSLEIASAAALAAHLVSPLLGICSGLLSLLREHSEDDATLHKRIESAVDASGSAERIKEGRAAETFDKVGGPALLGRWVQHTLGVREKDLIPINLSLPSRPPRPFSPFPPRSPATGSRTPRRRASSPPAALTPPSAQQAAAGSPRPSPVKPSPSLARRMLDYDSSAARGERIGFDDSQTTTAAASTARNSDIDEEASETVDRRPGPRSSADEAEEPKTEEDDDNEDKPAAQASPKDPPLTEGHSAPLSTRPEGAESLPDTQEVAREEAKRKKTAEREAEEARRRERLQRLAPAQGGSAAPVKKKKRL
ncbi:hypothetical protein JCM10908_005245 [Rhodotorula pacifica]|uniref:uncharacterized protein n=1 Tax=Rhodotorula pacifica TaxID=1495444 RepID=UPI00317156FC